MADISDLIGLTLLEIGGGVGSEELHFRAECGRQFRMYHRQDCCEAVVVEDINGDLDDLIGHPILRAYESSSEDVPKCGDSLCKWTFYHITTIKGNVVIRWLGSSNGYYSVSVDFEEI